MSIYIGGFGSSIQLTASTTFPNGITITQFSDDTDPYDIPSLQILDKAMGANGDLVGWSKANPLIVSIAVLPNSQDDVNLSILLEANRVAKGKNSALDIITAVIAYPDQATATFVNGFITDGLPANALASSQRLKSKPYMFCFENRTVTNA